MKGCLPLINCFLFSFNFFSLFLSFFFALKGQIQHQKAFFFSRNETIFDKRKEKKKASILLHIHIFWLFAKNEKNYKNSFPKKKISQIKKNSLNCEIEIAIKSLKDFFFFPFVPFSFLMCNAFRLNLLR